MRKEIMHFSIACVKLSAFLIFISFLVIFDWLQLGSLLVHENTAKVVSKHRSCWKNAKNMHNIFLLFLIYD